MQRASGDEPAIALGQALALGILQGPTELLPISSSGHLTLLPWLLRWDWAGVDAELRKAFEVTLHCGTAAALVISSRGELRPRTARQAALLVLSVAPAALFGFLFERPIERRLGTPPTVALGLLAGGAALALSDQAPQTRDRDDADLGDALWLGLAQACALLPGVSRGGATLAAARVRGFKRADAQRLSRELALPVIAGAAVLKGARLRARRLPPAARVPFTVGALSSFASTLAARPQLRGAQAERPLAPYAAYRIALAATVLARFCSTRAPRR
jgi:undecaprenyl-diphosphatase